MECKLNLRLAKTYSFAPNSRIYALENFGGYLRVGEGAWINGPLRIASCKEAPVTIGKNFKSGFWVYVTSINDYYHHKKKPVVIGDNVYLGSGCKLLCVNVGDNSVVGANAVVTKDVPANEVWAGVPARKISGREVE